MRRFDHGRFQELELNDAMSKKCQLVGNTCIVLCVDFLTRALADFCVVI